MRYPCAQALNNKTKKYQQRQAKTRSNHTSKISSIAGSRIRIQDPGSRMLDQDLGSSILEQDPGSRILDQDPESWIQDPDPGSWIQDPDPGCWIQDPGSRMLDPGIQDPGSLAWVPGPGPGPGLAQHARHTCMGLLDLPGSTSLAWVYKSSVGLQV